MWQYVFPIITSLFVALIAVWFSHWLSSKREYRKAINSVKHEIATNIQICEQKCLEIDGDLLERTGSRLMPYPSFCDLAWGACKDVIWLRNSQLANKIDDAYFYVPSVDKFLDKIAEFNWGLGVSQEVNLKNAEKYILDTLLPRLKEAKELLEKES